MTPLDADAFGRMLEETAPSRESNTNAAPPKRSFANPLASAAAPLPPEGVAAPGGEGFWDHAWAWAAEPADKLWPKAPRPQPSDDPDVIARELGLAEASTADDLSRARRGFMWRNHPDRDPETSPDLANRRVAIANMLVDKALRRLREP